MNEGGVKSFFHAQLYLHFIFQVHIISLNQLKCKKLTEKYP